MCLLKSVLLANLIMRQLETGFQRSWGIRTRIRSQDCGTLEPAFYTLDFQYQVLRRWCSMFRTEVCLKQLLPNVRLSQGLWLLLFINQSKCKLSLCYSSSWLAFQPISSQSQSRQGTGQSTNRMADAGYFCTVLPFTVQHTNQVSFNLWTYPVLSSCRDFALVLFSCWT